MTKSFLLIFSLSLLGYYSLAQMPEGLSGTAFRTSVYLQWDAIQAFDPVGYNLYRSTTSGNYGAPVRQIGAYTDYTDYNLIPNTPYFYRISAFDQAGNESQLSDEISVVTNDNEYLKVASLDLLIPVYTGGMSATAPAEIMQGLEFSRGIFFRNTFARLNLKFHYMIIDGYPPLRPDGVADFNTIGADLSARGILDNQYDAIHVAGLKLYGWYGGAQWLGQTAGSMAYNYTGFDADNHYSRGDAWVFTHEFGHSLDLIIAKQSGFPEMIFNHYPWAHPMPPEIGVFDAGENFDGMSTVLRLFEHHLDYQAPWDGYVEVADMDHDGMPDNDPRLPNDELRYGSNPNLPDTDDDGLDDLAEFTADHYQGTDPNNPDTDGDGVPDGDDLYPASNFQRENLKTSEPIVVDGILESNEGWNVMGSVPFYSKIPGATLETFNTWDDEYLYFAFRSNELLKYYLLIDGSGADGIFASPVGWAGGDYSGINENAWGTAYYDQSSLIVRADDQAVYKKEEPVPGSAVHTTFANGVHTTEIRLPHNLGPGFGYSYVPPGAPEITELVFAENDTVGIELIATPLTGSNGYDWNDWRTKDWLTLNQPFHYYDMVLTADSQPGDYCNVYSNFPWEDWIARVSVGSIDQPSGKSPYSDFTSLSTDLVAGTMPPIELTTGFSYFTWDEYWKVWIDFNRNGQFEEPAEIAFQGILAAPADGTPEASLSGLLNIPNGIPAGTTRMRVAMKRGAYATPCEIIPFGEIEDYSVEILSSPTPDEADLVIENLDAPSNANAGDNFNLLFDLKNEGGLPAFNSVQAVFLSTDNLWDAGDTQIGQSGPVTVGPGLSTAVSVTVGTDAATPAGNYFLIVLADATGAVFESNENNNLAVVPFEISPVTGTYCTSSATFPWEDWIAGVQFAGIDNASGKSTYSDFTALTANVMTGQSYTVSLTTGYSWFTWDEYWRIWIDFNRDNDFSDPGEMVFSEVLTAPANGTMNSLLNGTITIPGNVSPGTTRMRVSMKRNAFATPCETLPFGEVEDYSINIGVPVQMANLRIPNYEVIPGYGPHCFTNPGHPFQFLGGIILNDGDGDAGPFDMHVLLSRDELPGPDDFLWKQFSYAGLTANNVAGFNIADPVPASLPPGNYFLIFQIDPGQNVPESNENDNLVSVPVQLGAPDFSIGPVIGVPATATGGSSFNLSVDLTNLAPFPLDELTGDLGIFAFLSGDDVFSSDDLQVGQASLPFQQFTNGPLYNGGTATAQLTATLPVGLDAGGYFLFVRIVPVCEQTTDNNFSPPIPLQITTGTPGDYCTVASDFPWEDWIAGVSLNTLDHSSGKSAYSDFTAHNTILEKGLDYEVNLTTGYSWTTWDEYWSVWIDLNHDHVFQHPEELLFASVMARPVNGTPIAMLNGNIKIPATAATGPTRMRVIMKRDAFALPCENIDYGEIEDYTVQIANSLTGPGAVERASNIGFLAVKEKSWVNLYSTYTFPAPVTAAFVERSANGEDYEPLAGLPEAAGSRKSGFVQSRDKTPLSGWNYYRLRFELEDGSTFYSHPGKVDFPVIADLTIFPNPASEEIFVKLDRIPEGRVNLTISDMQGRVYNSQIIEWATGGTCRLFTGHLKPGAYFLSAVRPGMRTISRRFLIIR